MAVLTFKYLKLKVEFIKINGVLMMKFLILLFATFSLQSTFAFESLYTCTAPGGAKVELLVSPEIALLGADEFERDLTFNGTARYRRFTAVEEDSKYQTLMVPALLMRNRSNQGVVRAFTQNGTRIMLSCQK